MPLTTEERATLLELFPTVHAGGATPSTLAWAEARRDAVLEELGSIPGFDTTRAAVLRMLPALVTVDELGPALDAADTALDEYPASVAEGDPMVLLARHPAWVGLAAWQIHRMRPGNADRAVALAAAGFAATSAPAGRGEVLWALSETAEEAGWTDDAAALLALAGDGPFALPDTEWEVALLLALAAAEADAPDAAARLERVAESADAPDRTRTHARWVLAVRAQEARDNAGFQRWMGDALAGVDAEAEPDVAERIRAALER